ncbi:carbohydrate ABC transporter membrane protein 2 (CUT1 family) [Saccharopolyspora erythraea NRRL 2338]|uniref:ABC transporter sugar permease n=2 Tax=Saccharopolyspora erythraea TaxID=1836 RepID=A4FII8_SACEN|nr:carbohydrate ABC transporter permease [Saccharopolyspora erythraea]EQD87861.1 ABC transporter permease [Saccharopolyspora erythraea D]PFG97539.1 carbohydrate ABC transporter membrane protein 2 (CUT1 family) [Saccharopolyspora erythraea NRRL 2338]QRK87711.1 carbohydrate ABC transporter permease [Saccharopolyspora erythraea]CAM03863.1 ABC transporter sugar permease [Saccharopolyspora erythraea NRRL 2338]
MTTPGPWRIGTAFGYAVLVVGAVLYLGPFAIQLATSFKTDADAVAHPLSLIPSPVTTGSYQRVATDPTVDVPRWLGNSLLVTACVTIGRLLVDSMAGYALSRLRWRGRKAVFSGVLVVMAVPSVVLLIPKFLLLRQLSMYDSYSGMILPLLADAMGIFLMKQAFEQVPAEVEESAKVDGAGVVRRWWSVVLPMVRPALITLAILAFQSSWNEFAHFLVATSGARYETLTVGLARLVSGALGEGRQLPLKLTIAMVATVPVAVVFLFSQRYLVRGQTSGAVKG